MTKTETENRSRTLRFPKRVVVLGNDAVAWMVAMLLARHFISLQVRTTVCSGDASQPPSRETFSSAPSLTALLQNFGADEHDLLKACRGTYRLATQFSDWASEGRDFWQPLGSELVRIEGLPLFDVWAAERIGGRLLRPLHSYSDHWTASLAGKAPHSFSGTSPIAAAGQYGFHGESAGLANWFRTMALMTGVEEIPGSIDRLFPNGRGGIGQIKLSSGQPVPGDLFLDCRIPSIADTGSDLQNLNHQFLCDRVVSFRVPASRQVHPFTRITAHEAGWMSTIPLATEIEYRYTFCSRFQSDDDALATLKNSVNARLNQPLQEAPETSFQDVTHYRRGILWKDNVLHLGRSAFQLESLAATDLHLAQTGVELLLELFPDRSIGQATRAEYQARMTSITDEAQSFLRLHHALFNRNDSPYRRELSDVCRTEPVKDVLDVYAATGVIRIQNAESTPAAHYHSLLAGCGLLPARPSLNVRQADSGRIQQTLRDLVKHNEATVKALPLHEELLDWIHAGPFQQKMG